MNLTTLTAISPVDGRYRTKVDELAPYFSEWALIRYRLQVEVEYFISLCRLPLPQLENFPESKFKSLQSLYISFGPEDALRVKEIESITNHYSFWINLTGYQQYCNTAKSERRYMQCLCTKIGEVNSDSESIISRVERHTNAGQNPWTTSITYKTWKRNGCFC